MLLSEYLHLALHEVNWRRVGGTAFACPKSDDFESSITLSLNEMSCLAIEDSMAPEDVRSQTGKLKVLGDVVAITFSVLIVLWPVEGVESRQTQMPYDVVYPFCELSAI